MGEKIGLLARKKALLDPCCCVRMEILSTQISWNYISLQEELKF